MRLTTAAAVCRAPGQPWQVTSLQLADPGPGQVRVALRAAGLCHDDDHVRTGALPARLPVVGGHEGAGVVESVGPAVTRVAPGDHVACTPAPACGQCRYCSTGRQYLCDAGDAAADGLPGAGPPPFSGGGEDVRAVRGVGAFSQYAVVSEHSVVKVGPDVPFDVAALLACGVPCGWGSAVCAAGVRPGDTVVVYGAGGAGAAAVQGASLAGARHVVVVDPAAFKREMAAVFGATAAFATAAQAREFLVTATRGELADHAIVTVGVLDDQVLHDAIAAVGKSGQVTVTARGGGSVDEHPGALIGYQRRIQGCAYGSCNPLVHVPMLAGMYLAGDLKLDEMITRRYSLEQVNKGYQDMHDGTNIRGVIIHEA